MKGVEFNAPHKRKYTKEYSRGSLQGEGGDTLQTVFIMMYK